MLPYYKTVFLRAFWDAVSFSGQTKTTIIFAVLIIVLGALWECYERGWKNMLKRWWRTVGKAIFIALVAWGIVFVIFLVRTPYEIHREDGVRIQATEASLKQTEKALQPLPAAPVAASLKQRTLLLANKIQQFTEQTYPSAVVGDTNPGLTDEEKQAQQKKYDSKIAAQFQRKFYKETSQIVAEYKAKGIYVMPTEGLLSQEPKETRVGNWFEELIKNLRELGNEIDDRGYLIK
jgi:hypothetical protein